MMRMALNSTVRVEVAEQLNRLVNGEYRSKKLVKDIKNTYGPHSDATPKSIYASVSVL
jgi:hypothetical protein